MDCEQFQALLNADLDGELQPDQRQRLRGHLRECPACRAADQALRLQDGELRRVFTSRRQAAAAVADRVIAQLRTNSGLSRRRLPWMALLLSAAAGFLFAVLLFRPWQRSETPLARAPESVSPAPQPLPSENRHPTETMLLAVASAAIEFQLPQETRWQTARAGSALALGCRVRTGPEVRCEFHLDDGSEVRLNQQTELRFPAHRQLELIRGQILTRAAHAPAAFQVAIPDATITALGTEFDVMCQPKESVLTVLEGATRVEGKQPEQVIHRGEAATIVDGAIIHKQQVANLLRIKSWTNEILMLKGRHNKELTERVNDLLAQLGHSKTEFLEEQEIRGLGDHCVLPLTRFIQSERSRADANRRHMAAGILADLAQPWSIADLLMLLRDPDGEVRVCAAKALQRLTQQTFGCAPDEWRRLSPTVRAELVKEWETWWQANRQRYPRSVDAPGSDASLLGESPGK